MNPLLIGTAEMLPAIREDVQRMTANPGLYILTDENQPGAEIPVVSIGGKLFAVQLSTELAPERFLPTARVAGGPYRAHTKPVCTCAERIKAAIQSEPSGDHDYVDEVLGLLRVARQQRDDAERRRLNPPEQMAADAMAEKIGQFLFHPVEAHARELSEAAKTYLEVRRKKSSE